MKNRSDKTAPTERRRKAKAIIAALKRLYPEAKTVLRYGSPWELYVAVVLSAQTTDKKVNEVTERLFKKYRTLDDYVNADPEEFNREIRQIGFHRNKTKSILGAAKKVKEQFAGEVPRTMEALRTLPGVGRKTANVIQAEAFGIAEGIAVDTHVKRLARRWGLTNETDPDKIERDLMAILPREDWLHFNFRVVDYGRDYCPARPHPHEACPLSRFG
ncbi:endonuclease III [Candidatus Manganitrophus noduliformans]|uniref:Endonuclease III n=1 Tax=Candidatus Manganitrophus noduliformans TaxID=2606439 RepID=A0A7X6DRA9_9BACT|nr:endonuclease III [Candidatus Manganitrophus noduliformans]NKE71879.1 endonuclease III [Candidatus Manganitrophus noduliformans]